MKDVCSFVILILFIEFERDIVGVLEIENGFRFFES